MKVRVVQLMSNGCRRPREECRTDRGLNGILAVTDFATGNPENRPLRMASLSEPYGLGVKRELVAPLFDVELLRITSKGLLLRGFQISTSGNVSAQYAQEWWCEAIRDTG